MKLFIVMAILKFLISRFKAQKRPLRQTAAEISYEAVKRIRLMRESNPGELSDFTGLLPGEEEDDEDGDDEELDEDFDEEGAFE